MDSRNTMKCACRKCKNWEEKSDWPPCEERAMLSFREDTDEWDWDDETIRAMLGYSPMIVA